MYLVWLNNQPNIVALSAMKSIIGRRAGTDHAIRRRASKATLLEVTVDSPVDVDYQQESPAKNRKRRRRRRRSNNHHDDETPFYILVLQVGATLFVVCVVLFTLVKVLWPREEEEYYYGFGDDDSEQQEVQLTATDPPEEETIPPLPVWELGEKANYDAFAFAEKYGSESQYFWKIAASIREEFASRYGGENAARAILERGLSTFGTKASDIQHTACRIRDAKIERRPFKFAFGGYSVTTGRGNFFSQSFPFVMERILQRPFQILGVELTVLNAAIGGVPSFPYGWCFESFWGDDPDVVSWDYSMNEAGGVPEGLEAYLRHTLMLDRQPKLIVKDTHMADKRRQVLEHYTKVGFAEDPVVIHTDPAAEPFLIMQEEYRPQGFQQWRKFGAPPGAPGQALHHPAVAEHEFIGWLIAMHFLSALELLAAEEATGALKCDGRPTKPHLLPPPVTVNLTKSSADWLSLLFGDKGSQSSGDQWKLNPVRCKTTFEPILNGTLGSVVVSGTVGDDLDLTMPKGGMYYTKGWVLDLSHPEVLAKRKLDRFGGLGFMDVKKAYYGIYASGTLGLFLPYEAQRGNSTTLPEVGDIARKWIPSIVTCEVNEKREGRVCNIAKDVSYVVGGVNASKIRMIDSAGTLYYGKKICVYIRVPGSARISAGRLNPSEGEQVGLSLNISVSDMHIMKKEMACSVSHVVWEQTS